MQWCLSRLRFQAFSFLWTLVRLSCASCCPTTAVVALTARSLAAFTAGSSPSICCLCCQNHIDGLSAVCAASSWSMLLNHARASVKVTPERHNNAQGSHLHSVCRFLAPQCPKPMQPPPGTAREGPPTRTYSVPQPYAGSPATPLGYHLIHKMPSVAAKILQFCCGCLSQEAPR